MGQIANIDKDTIRFIVNFLGAKGVMFLAILFVLFTLFFLLNSTRRLQKKIQDDHEKMPLLNNKINKDQIIIVCMIIFLPLIAFIQITEESSVHLQKGLDFDLIKFFIFYILIPILIIGSIWLYAKRGKKKT